MLPNSPKPDAKPSRWEGLSVANHIKENVGATYQRRKRRARDQNPEGSQEREERAHSQCLSLADGG